MPYCVRIPLAALILAATAALADTPPAVVSESHALLAELVGIDSTHARGTTGVARAIAGALTRGGYTPNEVELVLPAPDKGSVLVHLKGRGKRAPILFLGHIDVVEARPEDWSVPPFTLTERAGYFYGRGTEDIKGMDTALLTNLLRLKREGFVPAGDLYVAFTSDEEAGGTLNGVDWLLKNRPELAKVEWVLNVDAGGVDAIAGEARQMRLQTSEKVYATFRLEVTGRGGHSSLPTRDNAIYTLAAGLTRLADLQFPVHLTDTTRSFITGLTLLPEQSADLRAVAGGDAAAAARVSANPILNALLRTTCVATQVDAGHGESALPVRARATIQCRIIPGESPADIEASLVRALADPRIRVSATEAPIVSPESPANPKLMGLVTQVAQEIYPGIPVLYSMDAGASDSVYPRIAGLPSYGVSGLLTDIDDHRLHGSDERIRVSAFDRAVEFYYRLMKRLGEAH
jgi:acetylornithine deacetylase/succinyl-diaminopimelate desuccinylase-like protein